VLNAEYFEGFVITDGDPVGLRRRPLDLVDLAVGGVSENRIVDGTGHLLDIPNEGLVVVTGSGYVARGMWCPSDAIDARAVIGQASDWGAGNAHIQYDNLDGVHGHGGEIIGILLVPAESKQRLPLHVFVDNGRMLEMTQIEHSDGTVGADRREHISTSSGSTEGNIIDFFVVCD